MFTGIVEELGTVVELDVRGGDARLRVEGPTVVTGTAPGDSIAVDGVCLTVVDVGETVFGVDVMPESLTRTALGRLEVGGRVNLERAVRADGRLDGHLVQGHVDGVGTLLSRTPGERWDDLAFGCPPALDPVRRGEGLDRGQRGVADGDLGRAAVLRRLADPDHTRPHDARGSGGR